MKKHVKSLKELLKFDIALKGDIVKILENPQAWAENFAEEAILEHLGLYRKAKKMGEKVAREIKS